MTKIAKKGSIYALLYENKTNHKIKCDKNANANDVYISGTIIQSDFHKTGYHSEYWTKYNARLYSEQIILEKKVKELHKTIVQSVKHFNKECKSNKIDFHEMMELINKF